MRPKFNIEAIRNMLRVNKHRLDDELELQAEIQDTIAEYVSHLNSRMLEAKDTLSRTEARLFADLKADKVANELANAEVQKHPERTTAWKAYQVARADYEEWQGLHNAWISRGFHLKVLADLFVAQYFAISTVTGPSSENVEARIQNTLNASRRPAQEVRQQKAADPPAAQVMRRRPLT